MSANNIAKHYARLLSRWPRDLLRPDLPFHKVLQARAQRADKLSGAKAQAELRNVNALYSLLDDRYKKKYPVPRDALHPSANPSYYEDLVKELEEAPKRNWWQRTANRWKGFIRWK